LYSDRWRSWGSGAGVKLALIDGGIDPQHLKPAAASRIVARRCFGEAQDVTEYQDADAAIHGTLCAAIVLELAPACELVDCCVTRSKRIDAQALAAAIEWVSGPGGGAKVINISVGTQRYENIAPLRSACIAAASRGAVIVAACANNGAPSMPSAFDDVIAVESLDLGRNGRWCRRRTPGNRFFMHGGTSRPRTLRGADAKAGAGQYPSMSGNSGAAAAFSAQVARLISTHRIDAAAVCDAMTKYAAGSV